MKGKRWLVLALVIILLLVLAVWWLSADPGVVLIRFRGWRVEATLVGAVALLIAAWIAIGFLWWLLLWPFGAMSRRRRRISHERLRDGLVALNEGRNVEAHRTLQRAAQYASLRSPALLSAAEAAHRHGDTTRALETLDEAAQHAPEAARILRARVLRESGRAEEALQLLAPGADAGKLPPAGWHEFALAALAIGQPEKARTALEPLRKSDMLGATAHAELVDRVLGALLGAAPDADTLQGLWKHATRQQRQMPTLIEAYARRAAALDVSSDALDAIEDAVKREWTPALVAVYGDATPPAEAAARQRTALRWLEDHPSDDTLLRTLGVLSLRASDPRDAREYLVRALALHPTAASWAALGDVQSASGETDDATRCYANAWKCTQGEIIAPRPQEAGLDTSQFTPEERDEHGVPRLPT
ncbi:MAG TPA: heme biosynthesis HemY N-terminal domain-containing protein [Rhodanobacteraceae bacterium]|jgi:HemY protein|nr:heme biosynthesis HemY N-terminal domain-containing protein [Rhodanobacteraceae bacterium]